ncbi:hypothetical protein BSK33_11835 [Geobacillus sp. 44B]|nr:hypothetical protein BSK33_11835 [Geobacillus sp. 44B]
MTKEKKLKQMLEETQQRLQLVVEHSTDYILIFSNQRELIYIPSLWKKEEMASYPCSYEDPWC